jgi:hypothetical protein
MKSGTIGGNEGGYAGGTAEWDAGVHWTKGDVGHSTPL